MDESVDNAREAIELWLETMIDDGGALPGPGRIAGHQGNPDFAGWVWAPVPIDPAMLSDTAEQVNITLAASVLRRIDASAKAAGEARSGFIVRKVLAG